MIADGKETALIPFMLRPFTLRLLGPLPYLACQLHTLPKCDSWWRDVLCIVLISRERARLTQRKFPTLCSSTAKKHASTLH